MKAKNTYPKNYKEFKMRYGDRPKDIIFAVATKDAKEAGRKEVVEWMLFYEQNDEQIVIPLEARQAKLKSWGLSNDTPKG